MDIFIDISTGKLMSGNSNASPIQPTALSFFYPDPMTINIHFMTPVAGTVSILGTGSYEIVPTTGLLPVVILDGGALANPARILSQASGWLPSADLSYFSGSLPLNVGAIQQLLGQKPSATCYLKVGYIQNGNTKTVFVGLITIQAGLPAGALVEPTGLTPLSQEAALQEFLTIAGRAGQGFTLISPDGTKKSYEWLDNNGVRHSDISP